MEIVICLFIELANWTFNDVTDVRLAKKRYLTITSMAVEQPHLADFT